MAKYHFDYRMNLQGAVNIYADSEEEARKMFDRMTHQQHVICTYLGPSQLIINSVKKKRK